MKKLFLLSVSLVVILLSSCVSMGISLQGKNYFIGKDESVLIEYFGDAVAYDDEDGEYDKVVYYTNMAVEFLATKTTTQRYKVSSSQEIFNLYFKEMPDGCLLAGLHDHYAYHMGSIGGNSPSYYTHNSNDNVYIRREIENFNSQVERLRCIAPEEQTARFNKSKIGDWFFVSNVTKNTGYSAGNSATNISPGGNISTVSKPSETYTSYSYKIWRVDVTAKDEVETEQYVIATYYDRFDQYYDDDNTTVSEERAKYICDWYEKEGFEITTATKGFSVLAYIKDGKVIKVE